MAAKIANKIANHNVAARADTPVTPDTLTCKCTSGTTFSLVGGCSMCTDKFCYANSGKPGDKVACGGDCGAPCGGGNSGCFAKDSSTACLLASPATECEHVLVSDLALGDLVLGREGATSVVAVQHKAVDTIAEMLTFHTAAGAMVSMTPDHAVFANGELVAAADVKVGSVLSSGAVERITKSEGAIINVVTASGTIVADGVLAASNPLWIASLTVDAPLARAVVNAVLYAVGDVDSVAAGFVKVAVTAFLGAAALKQLKNGNMSK